MPSKDSRVKPQNGKMNISHYSDKQVLMSITNLQYLFQYILMTSWILPKFLIAFQMEMILFMIVIVIVIAVGEVRGEEGELDEDDDQTEADLGHQWDVRSYGVQCHDTWWLIKKS